MKKLAIALPTRNRADRIGETVNRSIINWRDDNTVLWIMVDKDDKETLAAARKLQDRHGEARIGVSIRPREDTIAAKWNRILELQPDADVYLAGADDDPYLTQGYDSLILQAARRFPDGIGMVYGQMANASFSRAVAPTRALTEKLGWMFPEHFPYWFVDHWTDDVAKLIGRISFADITTDQTRPGKTQELREVDWWATWFDAAYLMRRKQAHNIIESNDFDEPAWRKEVLLTHHPLVEFHSRWTNNHVRSIAKDLHMWSGLKTHDERYQRIKDKATAMVPHLLDDYGMHPEEAAWFRSQLLPTMIANPMRRAFA